jgi:hypothetical protein
VNYLDQLHQQLAAVNRGFLIEVGICNTACDVMLCHRLIAAINTYNKNRQTVNEVVAE